MDSIEKLSGDITAMIFLVNDKTNETSDYSNYILRRLTGMYDIPWISSVVNTNEIDIDSSLPYQTPELLYLLILNKKLTYICN